MNNSNLPIDKVVEEIIVEFEFFEDWEDKYAHIIDMGKKLESMEDSLKDEKTKLSLISHCKSYCNLFGWLYVVSRAPLHSSLTHHD